MLLNEEFPGRTTDPAEIAVAGDASSAPARSATKRFDAELASNRLLGAPASELSEDGDVTRITVPVGDAAIDAVRDLRADIVPAAFAGSGAEVLVTGDTAEELDSTTRSTTGSRASSPSCSGSASCC